MFFYISHTRNTVSYRGFSAEEVGRGSGPEGRQGARAYITFGYTTEGPPGMPRAPWPASGFMRLTPDSRAPAYLGLGMQGLSLSLSHSLSLSVSVSLSLSLSLSHSLSPSPLSVCFCLCLCLCLSLSLSLFETLWGLCCHILRQSWRILRLCETVWGLCCHILRQSWPI